MTGLSTSCGACKFLRRRCTSECIFAPYFCYEQAATHFAAVHKVFGASNVSKLLLHLPVQTRCDAAITISYEALARMHDPVYGCVAQIFALQQQVASLEDEIEIISSQMINLGVNIASCAVPFEIGNRHFAAEPDRTSNYRDQQDMPINQAWCSQMEFQQIGTEDEISQRYFNSSIFESLLEELNENLYLVEELNQDYYLNSPWTKSAAP